MDLQNFKQAFSIGRTVNLQCDCGKHFFSTYGQDEDLERPLPKDTENTIFTEHDIDELVFEGKHYSDYCNCWHERAKNIMGFLDSHHSAIADYLNAERKRLIKSAKDLHEVSE
ncbi:hypothetical protein [Hydrogenovibrio marinus]|uniref:Uncharacterized protein n=1 Tax=Hydrogenovibrio marinus TaxID=28885 RepID=A0A066ZQX0_HYDMR|nr:hypothetical protein [Hydrogenovibrio marinus]KDN94659.1 hypothetical protein EI16_12225 [Hydrogenovibrio marinus]